MSVPPESLADRLQTDRPHSARVWNYLLGGKDNYPPDSEIGEMILNTFPDFTTVARLQRHFLARAVNYLVGEAGIRQLLDVGTGLPTADNTHELAQRIAPDSRIVYVDNDPLVLTHAQALLKSSPEGRCAYVDADVRDPERILDQAARTLDFSKPIGLTMVAIMGQISDEENPVGIVKRLVSALPSGSYLALSDGTDTSEQLKSAVAAYNSESVNTYHLRPLERIADYFSGLELVEPGVVPTARWRPHLSAAIDSPGGGHAASGVARKP